MNSQHLQIKQHAVETSYVVGDMHIYSAVVNGAQILFDTGPPTEEGKDFLKKNVDFQNPEQLLNVLSLNRLCPDLGVELGKIHPLLTSDYED